MFCCFIANNMRILSSSFSISERTAIFCNIFFQQFSCQFLYMVSTCHLLVSFYLKDGIVYFLYSYIAPLFAAIVRKRIILLCIRFLTD